MGGDKYFDTLALHGKNVTPHPFETINQSFGVPPKPWINTEWHAMLYSATSPQAAHMPNEKQLTRSMLMDLMQQIKAGVGRVTFFCAVGNIDREALLFGRENHWAVHCSGLFRTRPAHEPRFAAVVLQHFYHVAQNKLRYRGGFALAHQQQVAWFEQKGQSLMVLWSDADELQSVDARIANLITPQTVVTQWDGKRVAIQDGRWSVKPQTMYTHHHCECPTYSGQRWKFSVSSVASFLRCDRIFLKKSWAA